jgi:hypothetical protein
MMLMRLNAKKRNEGIDILFDLLVDPYESLTIATCWKVNNRGRVTGGGSLILGRLGHLASLGLLDTHRHQK